MYVIAFNKNRLKWKVSLLKKSWSNDLLSNQIDYISSKNFLFKGRGHSWAVKEIINYMQDKNELEITNG